MFQPKIEKSFFHENCQKSRFSQKIDFSHNPNIGLIDRYMVRNESLGPSKVILRRFLIPKLTWDHFWENRFFGIFGRKNT